MFIQLPFLLLFTEVILVKHLYRFPDMKAAYLMKYHNLRLSNIHTKPVDLLFLSSLSWFSGP